MQKQRVIIKKTLIKQLRVLLILAVLMLGTYFINFMLGGVLFHYGLIPRKLNGLWGIFTCVWIHKDMGHLLGNLSALLVLSWLCLLRSLRYFIFASVFIIVLGDLLLWVFGRNASHIGASGWIFGLWALLLANGYFERTIKTILISLVVIVLYSGFIFGLLPDQQVSFEGHITGMIAGICFSWLTHKTKIAKR